MTDYQEITVSADQGIATITLNRPRRLNAYTPDMGEELVHAIRACLKDSDIRALIVTGAGRAFCAGADRDFLQGKRGRSGYLLGEEPFISEFASEMAYAAKPIIAAVNGLATGIGTTMLLPFDLRIAAEEASFGFPFVSLGIVPGLGTSYFLPQLVGVAKARELILSGATVSADEAREIGLITSVVPADRLSEAAIEAALSMTRHSPAAIEACKRVLNVGANASLPEAMAFERQESARLRRLKAS